MLLTYETCKQYIIETMLSIAILKAPITLLLVSLIQKGLGGFGFSSSFVVDVNFPGRRRRAWLTQRCSGSTNEWSEEVSAGSRKNIFFKKTRDKKEEIPTIPQWACEEVSSELTLPHRISLEGSSNSAVVIRLLQPKDVVQAVDMCVEEYGDEVTPSLSNIRSWSAWLESISLRPFVDLTLRLKMPGLGIFIQQDSCSFPEDHAVLVASVLDSAHNGSETPGETIVAMIEVSQQPADPNRNPPAYPIPLFLKQLYAQSNGLDMQGWITNLLVQPKYRGRGFAKLLLAAAEGAVKSSPLWRQQQNKRGKKHLFMNLHCDAGTVSGKIPQSLYKSAGYEEGFVMKSSSSNNNDNGDVYSWMGPESLSSSIVIIEGVPLLYLRKRLS